jgi:hypothetical protein
MCAPQVNAAVIRTCTTLEDSRTVTESHIGFLAYTDGSLIPRLTQRLQAALAEADFDRLATEVYAGPSGWRLRVAAAPKPTGCEFDFEERWGCWGIFGIERVHIATLPVTPLVNAIAECCVSTEAILGRSYHPVGSDLIRSSELLDRPDYLGWVQYFGPDLSSRLGPASITSAGFFRVDALRNGAYLAMTRERYDDDWPFEQRRPVLDKLGLTPRVLTARQPKDGRLTELRWC